VTVYLLDTNVVSEVMRSAPTARVIAFLTEHEDLWLSSVVIHELEFGLQRMAQGQRQAMLRSSVQAMVGEYEDRILPLDRKGAEWAARFRADALRAGRARDLGDALIAGTAKAHGLTVATRNVRDFSALDVGLIDPWQQRRP